MRSPLAAALALVACGSGSGTGPAVHPHGSEQWLDLGGIELVLDPTTNQRFIKVEEDHGVRSTRFNEQAADGGWARIEIHRRSVDDPAALEANPRLLQERQYLPDLPLSPATTAIAARAWTVETSLPEGSHHEDSPGGGHSTVQDLPRYQWMAAVVTPGAVFTLIYVGELRNPEDAALTLEQIVVEGRVRHGARAAALLARLRAHR